MHVNDSVLGRYGEKDKWHFGKLASINTDGTVDIQYAGEMWNGWTPLTEYGVKPGFFRIQKSNNGTQSPIAPPMVAPPAPPISDDLNGAPLFHVGQRVEAKFEGKSKWYGATVMNVNNGGESFKVKYDGGMWNSWMPVNEPLVPPHFIRSHGSDARETSFDHSPIRKSSDETATTNPAATRGGRGRKNSSSTTQPAPTERMTRAQLAKVEANSKKEVNENAPPPSTVKKAPNYAMRETNAMRAQREAAMKRRETLEMNELNKYGETFESKKEQKAAAKAEADKKHTFLKRASYSSKVGASSSKNEEPTPSNSSNVMKTPSNNKRLSASNQYRSNQQGNEGGGGSMMVASTQKTKQSNVSKQQQLQQYQIQKQNSMQEEKQGKVPTNHQLIRSRSLNTEETPNVRASMKSKEQDGGAPVVVIVRKRPPKEGETDVIRCLPPIVICNENKQKVDLTKYVHTHKFCYDGSFGEYDSTLDLYNQSISSLIDNFMGGGSSTCFCFGQTASGKTFTLFGAGGGQVMEDGEGFGNPEAGGVYMLAAQDVFTKLQDFPDLVLSVSMFEIYGQKVRDLLDNGKELAALEDGKGVLQLVGLTGEECGDIDDFIATSNVGRLARSTTATGANATSSRSHAAMLLRLVRRGPLINNKPKPSLGKFSLIDLAGSERGADNENTDKTTQMEGRQINQSLLALKEVIRAKELGRSHAPFRQSRLTQVLEESLTGKKCQTVVIGCISPNEKDIQQTVNTLRYAEGLRPGLKKGLTYLAGFTLKSHDLVILSQLWTDLAKKEKEALAREEVRVSSMVAEQEAYEVAEQDQYSLKQQQQRQRRQQEEKTSQMIAAKELELRQMKENQNRRQYDQQKYQSEMDAEEYRQVEAYPQQKEMIPQDGDEEAYDDEVEEVTTSYRDSHINPVNLNLLDESDDEGGEEDEEFPAAPKSVDLDDESSASGVRRVSSWSSMGSETRTNSVLLANAEEHFRDEDDHQEEEEIEVNSDESEMGYRAYNGGGGEVVEMLREQDIHEVEAILAKQDRTLSSSGVGNKKYTKTSSNSSMGSTRSRRQVPSSNTKTPQLQYVESPPRNNKPPAPQDTLSLLPYSQQVQSVPKAENPILNVRNSNQTSNICTPANQGRRNGRLSQSTDNISHDLGGGGDSGDGRSSATTLDAEFKSLQWRLKVKDDEILQKDKIIAGLHNRIADLSRVVEESDKNQSVLTMALKRERDRIESVETTYHEAMMKLEADINDGAMEREAILGDLEEKDNEVNQLVSEVEDREDRIAELKLMLKKLLESHPPASSAPQTQPRTTRSATKSKLIK